MIRFLSHTALLLCTYQSMADSQSDAVNERIPVRKAEMEAHWNIDCAAAWLELGETTDSAAMAPGSSGGHCGADDELRRTLELCAHIYQPPGEPSAQQCPDYREVLQRLSKIQEYSDCSRLSLYIKGQTDCQSLSPDAVQPPE